MDLGYCSIYYEALENIDQNYGLSISIYILSIQISYTSFQKEFNPTHAINMLF